MGMVSVKRTEKNYLFTTIASLVENLSGKEKDEALIVVLITEVRLSLSVFLPLIIRLLTTFINSYQ